MHCGGLCRRIVNRLPILAVRGTVRGLQLLGIAVAIPILMIGKYWPEPLWAIFLKPVLKVISVAADVLIKVVDKESLQRLVWGPCLTAAAGIKEAVQRVSGGLCQILGALIGRERKRKAQQKKKMRGKREMEKKKAREERGKGRSASRRRAQENHVWKYPYMRIALVTVVIVVVGGVAVWSLAGGIKQISRAQTAPTYECPRPLHARAAAAKEEVQRTLKLAEEVVHIRLQSTPFHQQPSIKVWRRTNRHCKRHVSVRGQIAAGNCTGTSEEVEWQGGLRWQGFASHNAAIHALHGNIDTDPEDNTRTDRAKGRPTVRQPLGTLLHDGAPEPSPSTGASRRATEAEQRQQGRWEEAGEGSQLQFLIRQDSPVPSAGIASSRGSSALTGRMEGDGGWWRRREDEREEIEAERRGEWFHPGAVWGGDEEGEEERQTRQEVLQAEIAIGYEELDKASELLGVVDGALASEDMRNAAVYMEQAEEAVRRVRELIEEELPHPNVDFDMRDIGY
uniref:Uncharacterized protein n=1 Tax=Chromera velia CCMP2878 TaxID=1169474 RepID=A0A0G4H7C3_9ALVE|eukprot:Cvel_25024.t1-p1 / transcript=Cvel_25024.t1 / gene=Cvel_25024 / organism=Chromera_velia_CCMP2878 / gene_product=hypothetical protein / transcript_product=hypothetical protein / location=Cvel_scaffold2776:21170-22690(+) / protein_length=507 / sequence_SO=supercontig / SO=protein_coding / is_pseudo=false